MKSSNVYGIMQPYFFPYLGYFAHIAAVDIWIVFDVTQYTPRSWMTRNRILHPNNGTQYISASLAKSSNSLKIYEAQLADLTRTRQSILGKLSHYKKKAPFYNEVYQLVLTSFEESGDDSLVSLNVSALNAVCRYLKIPFHYKIATDLSIDFPDSLGPGDWAPYICNTLKAKAYLNPVGGRELFKSSVFEGLNVSLSYLEFKNYIYETSPYIYEPSLSILDVLLWNSPSDILKVIEINTSISTHRE